MKLIAHRGNIYGPIPEKENSLDYIEEALNKGFDVEVDVWYRNGKYFSGHDSPTHFIPFEFFFLHSARLWVHAKTIETLHKLLQWKSLALVFPMFDFFYHAGDACALTSEGYIWTHPYYSHVVTDKSIMVLPGSVIAGRYLGCHGICSDYVSGMTY